MPKPEAKHRRMVMHLDVMRLSTTRVNATRRETGHRRGGESWRDAAARGWKARLPV
jgi:hypothetical protein